VEQKPTAPTTFSWKLALGGGVGALLGIISGAILTNVLNLESFPGPTIGAGVGGRWASSLGPA
jgi:hypothetical protein